MIASLVTERWNNVNTFSYDPNEASVKERCHVIELYTLANKLRHLPHEFLKARQVAEDAMSSWLDRCGLETNRLIAG